MSTVVNLRGDDIRAAMSASLEEMAAKVANGEVSGLVIVAVGPVLGQPVAHAVTQGDVDHLIGQMERIKLLMLMEAAGV